MKINKNPKIVLAGSVNSSRVTLEKLIEYDMNITGVLGLAPSHSRNVSGYNDLGTIASKNNLNFKYFDFINDEEIISFVKKACPDFLFVIGLSQLVRKTLLNIPKICCIGFHPTKLPRGRGRGAVAWLVLGKAKGAATFFKLDEGMDSGPIIDQVSFKVGCNDYASDVIDKILKSVKKALDSILSNMKSGYLDMVEQDHSKATYLGRRRPEDGLINWNNSAEEIHSLIRAVSNPLPGAYSYYKSKKMIIQKASVTDNDKYIGMPGRILTLNKNSKFLIQTGHNQILVEECEGVQHNELKVGVSLGLNYEKKIKKLEKEIEVLKRNG